ncbi:hypothetical protein PGTUg99_050234 [Puccinia graminis f. sp. tritici]|uniref:Uncharacterized protein n=1 Tax=Puccinia graminis f. sp. tritici TaxID=56615 RepID=A0A5B0NMQ0_PUCGR|nr:hypothetical protein PGTUg99_050234 [Puccinia graminis f. sp. tritici]
MQFYLTKYLPLAFFLIGERRLALLKHNPVKEELVFDLNELPADDLPIVPIVAPSSSSFERPDLNIKIENVEACHIGCKHLSYPITYDSYSPFKHKSSFLHIEQEKNKLHYRQERKPAFQNDIDSYFENSGGKKLFWNLDQTPFQEIKSEMTEEAGEENPNQETEKTLDVSDWNFVKIDPNSGIYNFKKEDDVKIPNLKNLFKFLISLKDEKDTGNVFYISPDKDVNFFSRYRSKHNAFRYPPGLVDPFKRTTALCHIMLKIAQEKLGLEFHLEFFTEIHDQLKLKFQPTIQLNQLKGRIRYAKELTQITITLIVLYMSLFCEHAGDKLKQQDIENLVIFFRDLWKVITKDEDKSSIENNFKKQLHDFLNLKEDKALQRKMSNIEFKYTSMAWKIVFYWLKENGKIPTTESSLSFEIIKKIVLYSNYEMAIQNASKKRKFY